MCLIIECQEYGLRYDKATLWGEDMKISLFTANCVKVPKLQPYKV